MTNKVSIYRDRRMAKEWVCRWFGLPDSVTGQQRRYSKAFRLKSAAEEFARGKANEFDEGKPRDGIRKVTLSSFCRDWLEINAADLSAETVRLYENTIRRLVAFFGEGAPLGSITPLAAKKFISQQGRLDGRGAVSNWTRHRILKDCRCLFADAVDTQCIESNPFRPNRSRKDRQQKRLKCVVQKWHRLTVDEYKALLAVAPTLKWQVTYALGFTAGLRRGELANLTWADVDFDKAEVTVQSRKGTPVRPPFDVKDYASRCVPIPRHTVELLSRLRGEKRQGGRVRLNPYVLLTERQYEGAMARWRRCQDEGRRWSTRYSCNNLRTNLMRHIRRAGIEPDGRLSLHDLRKNCGQNWADAGLPVNAVQKLMGHSDPGTTLLFYHQVDDHHRRQAARAVDALLEKSDVKLTFSGQTSG
jgi:integrase